MKGLTIKYATNTSHKHKNVQAQDRIRRYANDRTEIKTINVASKGQTEMTMITSQETQYTKKYIQIKNSKTLK